MESAEDRDKNTEQIDDSVIINVLFYFFSLTRSVLVIISLSVLDDDDDDEDGLEMVFFRRTRSNII